MATSSVLSLERRGLLGGSWEVISAVISKVTILMTHIRELITRLILTHGPPSRDLGFRVLINRNGVLGYILL